MNTLISYFKIPPNLGDYAKEGGTCEKHCTHTGMNPARTDVLPESTGKTLLWRPRCR